MAVVSKVSGILQRFSFVVLHTVFVGKKRKEEKKTIGQRKTSTPGHPCEFETSLEGDSRPDPLPC